MKSTSRTTIAAIATLAASLFAGTGSAYAQAPQPTAPERAVALKTSLATSQDTLRHYEWIETTIVSLKGEEKSNKQQRAYYGADGKLEKIEISASPAPEAKRGLRGRIVENKTAELTGYMQEAVSVVKSYVPPDPARIQAAKDAGTVTMEMLDPGRRARLDFPSFQKPGDKLSVEIDLVTNRPLSLTVSSYLDDAKDAVTMIARMGQFDDGTVYTSDITLDAVAKGVQVKVQNSGYRKVN